MVPYSYYLILLALLTILSGCTQTPPPKFYIGDQKKIDSSAQDDKQVIQGGTDPVIKPAQKPDEPEVSEQSEEKHALRSTVYVVGPSASALYGLLEVEPKPLNFGENRKVFQKSATHMSCMGEENSLYVCKIYFSPENGKVDQKTEKISTASVSKPLESDLQVDGLSLKKDDQLGSLKLNASVSKMIFHSMTAPVATFTLSANQEYLPGTRKKGVHLDCYEQFKKTEPSVAIYSCTLYFANRSSGEFSVIQ